MQSPWGWEALACSQGNQEESMGGEAHDKLGLDGAVSWGPCEERVPLAVDEEQTIGGRRLSEEPSKKAAAIVQAGDDGAGLRVESVEVRNDQILDSFEGGMHRLAERLRVGVRGRSGEGQR